MPRWNNSDTSDIDGSVHSYQYSRSPSTIKYSNVTWKKGSETTQTGGNEPFNCPARDQSHFGANNPASSTLTADHEEEHGIHSDQTYETQEEQEEEDDHEEDDGQKDEQLHGLEEEMDEQVDQQFLQEPYMHSFTCHTIPEDQEMSEYSEDEDNGEEEDTTSFKYILRQFSKDWLETEVNHKVSKIASGEFWSIATKWIFNLADAFKNDKKKKIPQFGYLRQKMTEERVPRISMDVGYLNKDTKELTMVNDVTKIPVKQFPADQFEKVFEIASVKVKIY